MAKTDKELTAEIVCSYIQGWCSSPRSETLQPNYVADMIQTVFDAVHSLPEN